MLLNNKECCAITDAVDFALSLLEEGEVLKGTLYNRDIKQFIKFHYGELVTIASNMRAYESEIFFSSSISAADLAIKLKNQDIL